MRQTWIEAPQPVDEEHRARIHGPRALGLSVLGVSSTKEALFWILALSRTSHAPVHGAPSPHGGLCGPVPNFHLSEALSPSPLPHMCSRPKSPWRSKRDISGVMRGPSSGTPFQEGHLESMLLSLVGCYNLSLIGSHELGSSEWGCHGWLLETLIHIGQRMFINTH